MNLLTTFAVLSIINVIASTGKSILTIKGGKTVASLANAGYFAFYNLVLIYTVADFPMIYKCAITFFCNLIGVFLVKLVEEMLTKDKLWEVKMTIRSNLALKLHDDLKRLDIPHNFYDISQKHTVFSIYCATQKESALMKNFVKKYHAKYFVSESKTL